MLENHDILKNFHNFASFFLIIIMGTIITGCALPGCPHYADTDRREIQDLRQKTAQTSQKRCGCGIQEDAAHVVCLTICPQLLLVSTIHSAL
jgi:hypothetical protein